MDITGTKILVAFLFGLIRLFFGLLPVKIYSLLKLWEKEEEDGKFINEKRHRQVTCCLALFQSFGGGVLFATCLLHMMPEVHDSVEELKSYGNVNSEYPYSQLIVCFGFFFVYFVEEISHWLLTKVPEESSCENLNKQQKTMVSKIIASNLNKISPKPKEMENGKAFVIENFEIESNELNEEDNLSVKKIVDLDCLSVSSEVQKENEKNLENMSSDIEQANELEKAIENEAKTQQQIFRLILVILALSLHAIFEGLAIGLQNSVANIWYLFTAVSIHSATILFCLGLELLLAKTKIKTIFVQILILSVTCPFGVLLGLLITLHANMNTKAKSTAVVLLEGLSAGTILYITFFEVLNREKERRVFRVSRAICILAGFTLMAILEYAEIYH